jgi:hypothetical protein
MAAVIFVVPTPECCDFKRQANNANTCKYNWCGLDVPSHYKGNVRQIMAKNAKQIKQHKTMIENRSTSPKCMLVCSGNPF